jgi:hypothetical protein
MPRYSWTSWRKFGRIVFSRAERLIKEDMRAGTKNVRSSGQTGNDRHMVNPMRMTQLRHGEYCVALVNEGQLAATFGRSSSFGV